VVAKLLAGDQQDRYESAASIREDLECVLANRPTLAERQGWPGRAQDEPATRRIGTTATRISEPDAEPTRRTINQTSRPAATNVNVVPAADSPAARAAAQHRGWLTPVRPTLRKALLIVVLMVVANELRVSSVANGLADTVGGLDLPELEAGWVRHEELREGTLGIGVLGLERALLRQTLTATDRVVANYRTPSPSVREAQWRAARNALVHALATRGDDRNVRALLRYCEGHLHRIDGEARKARKLAAEAQREFADALVAFREAAELQPDWADPYLGLMRTFIYGLDDVERGEDALAQAERRGYKPGDRETAQLAEGHRVRAETLVRTARELSGMAQEIQYLNRAVDEYRKALDFYSQVPTLGNTPRQMRTLQRDLASAEGRIAALTAPPLVQPAVESPSVTPAPPPSTP
jgi:hypothetical protein